MKRERKKKLTASEFRARGTTPDLVTRRLRLASLERGNRPHPTKDNAPEHSRRTDETSR